MVSNRGYGEQLMKRLILILLLIPSLVWATDIDPDIDVLPGTTVEVGEEVFFSASDTTYEPDAVKLKKARYEWDFGDGYYLRFDPVTWSNAATVTRSGVAATHYYMTPGTYTCTLSVKIFAGNNYSGDPLAFTSDYPYGQMFGVGSTKTKIAHSQIKYTIGGTTYTLAENLVGVTTGVGTIPQNMQGAVVLDVDAEGTVDVTLVTNSGNGYTYSSDAAATIAAIPAVAENHARLGYILYTGIRKAITFGTTELDDIDISVKYVPTAQQTVGGSIFTFDVGGTIYTLPAQPTGFALGDDVIPDGKYGAVALDVGTDLTVHTTEATDNATGYSTLALARAGIPAVAENHVRMGTVAVYAKGRAFTFGLNSISETAYVTTYFQIRESDALDSTTDTVEITVTGTQPLDDFEVQRANLNNRTKQYLYVQVPSAYQGGTTQLKISLIDTTADPDVTTTLYTKTSNLDAEEIYLFDHTTLTASHDYVIQTQLLDVNGDQVTDGSKGGIWRDKFTAPASTPTVTMNENNSFVIGGNLYFPIGSFMTSSAEAATYQSKGGVNMVMTEGYNASHSATTWGTLLDAIDALGVKGMGPGRGDSGTAGNGYYMFDSHSAADLYQVNRWQFNHDVDIMEGYVTANKTKAAMFAWNWQDEPNMGGRKQRVYPPTFGAWAYLAHANDVNHPVSMGFYGADWLKHYGTGLREYDYLASDSFFGGKKWLHDVLGYDIYPIQYFRGYTPLNKVDEGMISLYLDAMDRFITNNKNLAPFIPAMNPGDRNAGMPVSHSSDKVFNEAWLNVIHGAKGVAWFIYFDQATVKWDAVKKFSDQMNVAQSPLPAFKDIVLLAPSSRTVTDDSNIALNRVDFIARDYGSELWIFSARVTEYEPLSPYLYTGQEPDYTGTSPSYVTTFTVQNLSDTDVVTVVGENRTISHGVGSFSDQFAKNAVHIYRITTDTPAGDTTAPTVDAFEIPSTYGATTIPVTTFLCSDAVGVSHYLLNTVATTPSGSDAGWSATKQTTYAFGSAGEKTLYAWCKDAAGNISTSKSDTTTITIPSYTVTPSISQGCNVSPGTAQSVISEGTASFTVTAEDGYEITAVSGCGGTWSTSPYETGSVTEDCTVTFTCAPNLYYIVTPSAGTGCFISPNTAQTVLNGEQAKFTIGTEYGRTLVGYGGCGGSLDGSEYTTDYIHENCTVYVYCGGSHATVSSTGGVGTITFGTGGSAPSGCNEVTDKVGNTATDAAPPSLSKDVAYCQPFTPTCYGTLKKAYVNHVGSLTSSGKVCVYSDDGDSIANSGDLKIGCSGDITSGSTEWASSDMDGGTLSSGNYWVCIFVKSDAANTFAIDTTATTYPLAYKTSSGFYASPPANLNGLTTGSFRGYSMYVTIGN